MKERLKKYRFLFNKKFTEAIRKIRLQLKSILTKDHSRLDFNSLNLRELPYPVHWKDLFKYQTLNLEIGCGHGELLSFLARSDKKSLNIGFEITKEFTLKTSKKIKDIANAYVFKGDGYSASLNNFEKGSIDKIYILFPDPWHKKRHHKRRPLTEEWFRKVNVKLKKGSQIYFATDWDEYFDFVSHEVSKVSDLYRIETGRYDPTTAGLVETHYYKKWVKAGRRFQYIQLTSF